MVAGSSLVDQWAIVRSAAAIAVAAVLDAVVTPYLDFGWFSPKFTIVAIVFAASGLRHLQGILLGFFGGVLLDALGGGLFGVGTMAGLIAGVLSVRYGDVMTRGTSRFVLSVLAGIAVAAYDLVQLVAYGLIGLDVPAFLGYAFSGMVPDAFVNTLFAFLIGGWMLRMIRKDGAR
ncbi:MAG: rod shape-determining protein MreD [Rubrobacteraceae bacterium]